MEHVKWEQCFVGFFMPVSFSYCEPPLYSHKTQFTHKLCPGTRTQRHMHSTLSCTCNRKFSESSRKKTVLHAQNLCRRCWGIYQKSQGYNTQFLQASTSDGLYITTMAHDHPRITETMGGGIFLLLFVFLSFSLLNFPLLRWSYTLRHLEMPFPMLHCFSPSSYGFKALILIKFFITLLI